jgi:glucose-specific phosphotransferase system IIA component
MGLFGKKENLNEIIIYSPVDGKVKELSKVDDEVFAGEMVGKGVAVVPKTTTVYSPAKGVVKTAFPTGHAYGINLKGGASVLLHIGIDTVALNGEGFEVKTAVNKHVDSSSELAEIDLKIINKKAKASDIMVIITNDTIGEYKITDISKGDIKAGEQLFVLRKGE